ncbi:MAG: ABC transporter substrate-binding protein [Chloroflexi bacterium]|nr:ABC transporter substrate-binding protein [Chloroflexota bacterium]
MGLGFQREWGKLPRALAIGLMIVTIGCSSAPAPTTAPAPAAKAPATTGGAPSAPAPSGPAAGTTAVAKPTEAAAAAAKPAGAAPAAASTGPFLKDPTPLKFAIAVGTMDISYSITSVAEELFWEKEENLKVAIQPIAGSVPVAQALDAGSIEVGAPTPEPVLQSHDKGGSKAVWFYSFLRSPTGSLAVLDSSPIKSLADFKGKKIGAQSLGSGNIALANGIIAAAGVKKEEVEYLSVGLGAQALAALQSGQVDALTIFDSQYAAMENSGAKLRYFTSPQASRLFATTGTTTTDMIKSKPDVLKAFGRGLAKATLFTITNPEASIRIHWKRYPATKPTGVDEAKALSDSLNIVKKRSAIANFQEGETIRKWGYFSEASINAWIDFAAETGITSKKVSASALYTNEFVDFFNQFDEAKIKGQATNYRG